jgi:hypothetical protein
MSTRQNSVCRDIAGFDEIQERNHCPSTENPQDRVRLRRHDHDDPSQSTLLVWHVRYPFATERWGARGTGSAYEKEVLRCLWTNNAHQFTRKRVILGGTSLLNDNGT